MNSNDKTQLDASQKAGETDDTGVSRRLLLKGAAFAGAAAAGTSLLPGTAAAQSDAWKQPGNNNHVLALQANKSAQPGEVKVDYFGHCAFRITTPSGLVLLFDPWRNDPSGAWGLWFPKPFPEVVVDVTISTHTHFDHDAIFRPQSTAVLDRMVGTYSFADVTITGIADKHACRAPGWYKWTNAIAEFGAKACPPDNPGHMDNVMYVVETGGVRILIWGDNRHNPPEDVWQALGKIDVLTLPVDGSQHILSYGQGNDIVARLEPNMVIPTHYLCEGTSLTLTTLQAADDWVKSQKSYKMLEKPSLSLAKAEVKGMKQEFAYFGSNVLKS